MTLAAAPWSSGPMYFLALRGADGNEIAESLWTETLIVFDADLRALLPEHEEKMT